MAQIKDGRDDARERVKLVARQRPGYVVAALVVVGALLGAAAFGALEAADAGGVVIESGAVDDEVSETAEGEDAGDGEDASGDAEADEMESGDEGSSDDSSGTVVVDISGAVASPAVVELPAGSRVADAIEAAGGLTDDADISDLNRAAELTDGEKVYVPHEGEEAETTTSTSTTTSGTTTSSDGTELVNINTADADELDTLPGVGPATAEAIIEDREANGEFTCIEDIMRVSGIGEAKFADMQDYICV